MRSLLGIALLLLVCVHVVMGTTSIADEFTYVDRDGATVTLNARLAGEGQGQFVLEAADGQLSIVPQGAVSQRTPGDDPTPMTPEEMVASLEEKFGKDLLRSHIEGQYVIAIVLIEPLERDAERQATAFLKKAGRFMKTIDGIFEKFARSVRVPVDDPKFPMVLIVFEADSAFEKYATDAMGGQGLSAGRVSGFYSGLTNWLAIRMHECHTFEVPLHEAIHQQVYNRGWFRRLAPIPSWFNEGIATGFEGSGDRIKGTPEKVNSNYARRVQSVRNVDWDNIVGDDSAFRGDVLAGEAYTLAWCLHWMVLTQHKENYSEYVKRLGLHEPLQEREADDRKEHFEETFGASISGMQKDFPAALISAVRRQKVDMSDPHRVGITVVTDDAAEVEMTAVRRTNQGGRLDVQGRLRNLSPFRTMAFRVIVQTEAGEYADWVLPSVKSNQVVTLPQQFVIKQMQGAPGGLSQTFRVSVHSVLASSREAEAWAAGTVPVPVYGK